MTAAWAEDETTSGLATCAVGDGHGTSSCLSPEPWFHCGNEAGADYEGYSPSDP